VKDKIRHKQTYDMGRVGRAEKDVRETLKLYTERESNGLSVNDIVKMTSVPRSTIYAKIKEQARSIQINVT
jgi:DNA invertase Pin-like site-specific DNA recombinase